jgi:hypothetical protein
MYRARILKLVPGMACLWTLLACEMGGGGSSSETESSIAGELRNPDNRPAVAARVSLVPGNRFGDSVSTDPPGSLETLTDSNGRFEFRNVGDGLYLIQGRAWLDESALGTQFRVEVEGEPASIRLEPRNLAPTLSAAGRIVHPSGGSPMASLYLYGTGGRFATDPQGGFTLADLPAGLQLLRIVPEDPALGPYELAFRSGMAVGEVTPAPEKILRVADFENGMNETPFAAAFPRGTWYADEDLDFSARSTFSPSSIRQNFGSAYTDSGAWRGRSLHVNFIMQGSPAAAYAAIGYNLGRSEPGYDLTALDSVVFMAKGSGKVRMEFQTRPVLEKYGDWRHFAKEITLSPAWTRISIPIAAMALAPGSPALKDGLTWAAAGKQVVNAIFIADNPADLWLDDLLYYGMSIEGM